MQAARCERQADCAKPLCSSSEFKRCHNEQLTAAVAPAGLASRSQLLTLKWLSKLPAGSIGKRVPRMFKQIKHAFAVTTHPDPPTPEQVEVMERVAVEIVRRRLTTPALAALEMSRPVNYLGAQALHFFGPLASVLCDAASYEHFARFLERRDAIDRLAQRIEELEAQATATESRGERGVSPP